MHFNPFLQTRSLNFSCKAERSQSREITDWADFLPSKHVKLSQEWPASETPSKWPFDGGQIVA